MGDYADDARDLEERQFLETATDSQIDERTRQLIAAAGGDYYRYDASAFAEDHPLRRDGLLNGIGFHKHRCAVVGLPYENTDGSKRRDAAERIPDKGVLIMVREPHNQYDQNAVAVYYPVWHEFPRYEVRPDLQVGYLPRGIAELYAPLMDAGATVFAVLEDKPRNKNGQIRSLEVRTGLLERMPAELESGNSPAVSRQPMSACFVIPEEEY